MEHLDVPKTTNYIDTHVHFYDIQRAGLTWPSTESPIWSSHLPRHHQQAYSKCEGVIVIETSKRDVDDKWLLRLAAESPYILGVIANLDICRSDFEKRLSQAQESSKFKGIRLRPIAEIDITSTQVAEHLARLADGSNVVEAGCPDLERLHGFTALAKELTGQTFVLDHFGHPAIANGRLEKEWKDEMIRFSRAQNTYCKITSLLQFSDNKGAEAEDYFPLLEFLEESFGRERLVFGSNWPVSTLCADHRSVEIVQRFFGDETLLRENALRLYKLQGV